MIAGQTSTLNFIVTGNVRSGTAVVRSMLQSRGDVVCHDDVLHGDEKVRSLAHASYFNDKLTGSDLALSPWQYVTHRIFNCPQNGEGAVGLRLTYPDVTRLQFCDFFATYSRHSNFRLIHVVRNPVACFVSLKQAERSGIWSTYDSDSVVPVAVHIAVADLVGFCNEHSAVVKRVRTACPGCLEVAYRDILLDPVRTLGAITDFLGLPLSSSLPLTECCRLTNTRMSERVLNWNKLCASVPSSVRQFLESDCLL